MCRLFNIMTLFVLCSVASISLYAQPDLKQPKGSEVAEAYVLSIKYFAPQHAKIVIRPCDEFVQCFDILLRADATTVWLDQDKAISYAEARKLDWKFAVVVRDRNNNALMLNRVY